MKSNLGGWNSGVVRVALGGSGWPLFKASRVRAHVLSSSGLEALSSMVATPRSYLPGAFMGLLTRVSDPTHRLCM